MENSVAQGLQSTGHNYLEIIKDQPGNLRVLFGLPKEKRVLAIGGKSASKYIDALKPVEYCSAVPKLEQGMTRFDCILFDADNYHQKERLESEFRNAVLQLNDNGIIFFLSSNFFCPNLIFSIVKKIIRGNKLLNIPGWWMNYRNSHKLLQSAGGYILCKYLPIPWGAEKLDQFLRSDSRLLENSYDYGIHISALQKFGVYKYVHPGYLYVKTFGHIENNCLFKKISESLEKFLNISSCHLKLEKFDLRIRGTLIAFIQEITSETYFIARVVSDRHVDAIVKKNQYFIRFIHSISNISKELKEKIPLVVDELLYQDSSIYIESYIKGVLAWKLLGKKKKELIFNEAVKFIMDFNIATKQKISLDETSWLLLFNDDYIRIEKSSLRNESKQKIYDLLSFIKQNLLGKEFSLVAAHGDFGYGNILLDPNSCKVTGVIDWDTGRKIEFPAVDLFNLLIQQERSLGSSLFFAAQIIMAQLESKFYFKNLSSYLQFFALTENQAKFIFGVTIIRYISRAAQYEAVLLKEENDYFMTMQRYEEFINI